MDLVPVQFLSGWKTYNAGEVAGFPKDEAEWLTASGVAVAYAPVAEVAEAEEPEAEGVEVAEAEETEGEEANGAEEPEAEEPEAVETAEHSEPPTDEETPERVTKPGGRRVIKKDA